MAIEFRDVWYEPLEGFSVSAPDGCIVGIVGERGCGDREMLRLAAGFDEPTSGEVILGASRRYLSISDPLNLAPVNLLIVDHAFAQADALVRARAVIGLDRLRAAGTTILIASHELEPLRTICDEIWWLEAGKLERRGNPREVLEAYSSRIKEKLRAWGETISQPLSPAFRKGDGRAEIVSLETVGAAGKPSAVLASGENAAVRATLKFHAAVPNPVIGIMLRTRIGLEVYGTNTDLEKADIGACSAGDTICVEFRFTCRLCPGQYTLTAASHDPDGTAHDWIDDAVSFEVCDSRATAGVANLGASVNITRV